MYFYVLVLFRFQRKVINHSPARLCLNRVMGAVLFKKCPWIFSGEVFCFFFRRKEVRSLAEYPSTSYDPRYRTRSGYFFQKKKILRHRLTLRTPPGKRFVLMDRTAPLPSLLYSTVFISMHEAFTGLPGITIDCPGIIFGGSFLY